MKSLILVIISLAALAARSYFDNSFPTEVGQEGSISQTPSASPSPAVLMTPAPLNSSPPDDSSLRGYIYPNSTVLDSSSAWVKLQSSDSPVIITDWYKTKITESRMNVRNFVQTTTNGEVLNKLVAAGPGSRVDIEIKKENPSAITSVIVSFE